jgi:hypothetical protein
MRCGLPPPRCSLGRYVHMGTAAGGVQRVARRSPTLFSANLLNATLGPCPQGYIETVAEVAVGPSGATAKTCSPGAKSGSWHSATPAVLVTTSSIAAVCGLLVLLFNVVRPKGYRSAAKRAWDHVKWRLQGMPKSGTISVVVTDIEGYSGGLAAGLLGCWAGLLGCCAAGPGAGALQPWSCCRFGAAGCDQSPRSALQPPFADWSRAPPDLSSRRPHEGQPRADGCGTEAAQRRDAQGALGELRLHGGAGGRLVHICVLHGGGRGGVLPAGGQGWAAGAAQRSAKAACSAGCGASPQPGVQQGLANTLAARSASAPQAQQALMKVEWPAGLAAAGLLASSAGGTPKRGFFSGLRRPSWLSRDQPPPLVRRTSSLLADLYSSSIGRITSPSAADSPSWPQSQGMAWEAAPDLHSAASAASASHLLDIPSSHLFAAPAGPPLFNGLRVSSWAGHGWIPLAWLHAGTWMGSSVLGSSTRSIRYVIEQQPENVSHRPLLLQVRMGVATGRLLPGQDIKNCGVVDLAKAVSDMGAGGQVLLDDRTFADVKERLRELGAVDGEGINWKRLTSRRSWWARLTCSRPSSSDLDEEAVVLDMGLYSLPPALQAAALAAMGSSSTSGGGSSRAGSLPVTLPRVCTTSAWRALGWAMRPEYGHKDCSTRSSQQLRVVQLLAPALVGRAKVFGNALALRPDMVCEDMPYFDGPGTAVAPLGPEPCLQAELPEVRGGMPCQCQWCSLS